MSIQCHHQIKKPKPNSAYSANPKIPSISPYALHVMIHLFPSSSVMNSEPFNIQSSFVNKTVSQTPLLFSVHNRNNS